MLLLTATVCHILLIFVEPAISIRLEELGVNENDVGYIFVISPVMYTISAIVCGNLSMKYNRITILMVSTGMMIPTLWVMGPSLLLGLP